MSSCLRRQVRVLAFEDIEGAEKTVCFEPERDPRGMGVEALLTSDVYGLSSALDWVTQNKLNRKRALASRIKEGQRLDEIESEELQRLSDELSDLGFTYTMRDPLYAQFVEAMTEERERHPGLQKRVLSKEERNLQADLARKIAEKLLSQGSSEK